MDNKIFLSLVIPFYNPGPRFTEHVIHLVEALNEMNVKYEIIAISDGSTDGSEAQIKVLATTTPISIVVLETNQGKGSALKIGLSMGQGEYLGFIDADGDIPASLLKKYIEVAKEHHPDILFGNKRHKESEVIYPKLRRIYSWTYQQLIKTLFNIPIQDTQTGIKIIKKEVLDNCLPFMVEKRFAFDLELFVVAKMKGYHYFIGLPVTINERFNSTISLNSIRRMLQDTFAIFYRLYFLGHYD